MTTKKALRILTLLVILIPLLIAIQIVQSAYTPHGRLDLKVALILQLERWTGDTPLPHSQRDAVAIREAGEKLMNSLKGEPIILHSIEDRLLTTSPAVPVRIYRPSDEDALPVLVYFHGGGWTGGSLESHDNVCRYIAKQANIMVVAVDWRRAPEHPFPAGLDDAYAATLWVSQHAQEIGADPQRLAVGGDSSGGNFAAVVAQMSRDRQQPYISHQALIYPATDLSNLEKASYKNFESGYGLGTDSVKWYLSLYLDNAKQVYDTRVSPLLAERFTDLPSVTLLNAQFDVLNSDGDLYEQKLKASGVPVERLVVPGVIHGFVNAEKLLKDRAYQGLDFISAGLRKALHNSE